MMNTDLQDNWDNEGAQSFDNDFIDFVSNIIIHLDTQPDIFPLQNGDIVMEFGNVKDIYLGITIMSSKQMNIYKKDHLGNRIRINHIPCTIQRIKQELYYDMLII